MLFLQIKLTSRISCSKSTVIVLFRIAYQQLHKELLQITTDYDHHLKLNPSTLPDEVKLYNEKVTFIQHIKSQLEYTRNGLTFDKIQTIHQIRTLISSKNENISQYRGPDWKRYLRNMGVALACTIAFPIGGVAALVSKWKYNTFQFWQTTGYKEKESLLSKISSTENKFKNG